jgi:integration host factor beta subunit
MTKSALIEKVTEKFDSLTRKQTEIVVDTLLETMKDALVKGDKIEIRGFGNFRLKSRRPRMARNPKTGVKIDVPAKKALHFKAGKALREAMNSPNPNL